MRFIGVPLKRLEDPRLLVGGGRYVDDLVRPGTVHAVLVRNVEGYSAKPAMPPSEEGAPWVPPTRTLH